MVTEHKFTGQKQDNTGLVYMNARYYDPAIGAFISPDTIVPDAGLVSDYNRYLMARGNPLNFNDPSGHEGVAVHDSNDGPSPEWIDWEDLYAYDPDQLSTEMLLWLEDHQNLNQINGMTEFLASYFEEGNGVVAQFQRTYAQAFASAQLLELYQPGVYESAGLLAAMILSQVGVSSSEGRPTGDLVDCSFSRETLIQTASGPTSIASIQVGTLVFAYDESLGQSSYYPVSTTIAHVDPIMVLLTIDDEVVKTTPEHPFYVMASAPWLAVGEVRGRWVPAGELAIGDAIRQADGTTGAVQAVEIVAQPQVMYNLTVAEAHTFFVGRGQWLVHNQCGSSWRLGSFKSETKWNNQMGKRGWTNQQITEALNSDQTFPATNNINPSNPATRYVHPQTGRSVVQDNVTKEILHIGGDGFIYD